MEFQDELAAKTNKNQKCVSSLEYDVGDWPPFLISLAVACQHLVICISAVVTMTYMISDVICISTNDPIRSKIFCSSLFMVGIATMTQTLLGIRLPVFQGPSFTFLPPLLAMKTSGAWTCHTPNEAFNITSNLTTEMPPYIDEDTKYTRLNELQGSLLLASLVEVALGATGAVGVLQRLIGPITISVTVFLLGYSLYPVSIHYSHSYWPIAIMSALLVMLFGIYLAHVKVKLPKCFRKSNTDIPAKDYSVFNVFAIPFSIAITWVMCFVLTQVGVFSEDPTDTAYRARTDTRSALLDRTPWFYWPYPGHFGAPKFNMGLFIAFISVSIASAMESIGDYFATAKTCDALPVPSHAVNRGILIEGLMSILSALFGTGHATTSYTIAVSIAALTKVGSRYAVVLSGVIAIILAVFVKFGAVMSSMPDPIIGGISIVTTGIVLGLGISTLRTVDMTSSRNISVVGMSILIPVISSASLNMYPGMISTGYTEVDKVMKIVLGFPMIMGSLIAIILDNTVKGTRLSRGLDPVTRDVDIHADMNEVQSLSTGSYVTRDHLYDIPYLDKFCRSNSILKWIPFVQKVNISKTYGNT
ncbi:solute carrier family 23 member 2-like [Ylistrum balloti]|uniref:solute carrier family 23 member 2-like n=1 Tax=Ylistrum balloti TaxID=509963 RepID=UPI002905A9E6|nr:solute carrier family 23 member 2-like [Ylistrum balloti]